MNEALKGFLIDFCVPLGRIGVKGLIFYSYKGEITLNDVLGNYGFVC